MILRGHGESGRVGWQTSEGTRAGILRKRSARRGLFDVEPQTSSVAAPASVHAFINPALVEVQRVVDDDGHPVASLRISSRPYRRRSTFAACLLAIFTTDQAIEASMRSPP